MIPYGSFPALSLIHISFVGQVVKAFRRPFVMGTADTAHARGDVYKRQRRCRAAAAGAVLKPQGGNCAVLP